MELLSVWDYFLIILSYDVSSLFTNISLNETVDLAVDVIFDNNQSMNITGHQIKKRFVFALSQTNFLFNNEIDDQNDGASMMLDLDRALANICMGYNENKLLNSE